MSKQWQCHVAMRHIINKHVMTHSNIHIEGYRILRALYESADSAVYQLQSDKDKTYYALKIAQSAKGTKCIEREIQYIKALQDEGFDHRITFEGRVGPFPYFVTPYYAQTLQQYLSSYDAPLPERMSFCSHILKQLALPLTLLHKQKRIHGDISPNNIMLMHSLTNTDEQTWLLIDYASVVELESEKFTGPVPERSGTPAYMSPEQADGVLQLTIASDIYSLCSLAFKIICGQVLNADKTAGDSLQSNETLCQLPTLKAVLKTGLRRDSRQRYTSADALIKAFTEAVSTDNEYLHQKNSPDTHANKAESSLHDSQLNADTNIEATQAFSHNSALSQPLKNLKFDIVERLKLDGHLAQFDVSALAKTHALDNKIEGANLVVQSLIDEALDDLSSADSRAPNAYSNNLANYKEFLVWTLALKHYQQGKDNTLSKTQYATLLEQGLSSNAGTREQLCACVERNFKIVDSNGALEGKAKKSAFGKTKTIAVITACLIIFALSLQDFVLNDYEENRDGVEITSTNSEKMKLVQNALHTGEPKGVDADYPNQTTVIDRDYISSLRNDTTPAQFKDDSSEDVLALAKNNTFSAQAEVLNYEVIDVKTKQVIPIEFRKIKSFSSEGAIDSDEAAASIFVMSTEVSQQLWQACVNAGQCRSVRINSTSDIRKRLNHPQHPVVNVSWFDIQEDFIPFINNYLQSEFSLPSMATWLNFAYKSPNVADWPDALHCKNCLAQHRQGLGSSDGAQSSVAVNSLMPSSRGLYHVYGNAQEWLQDCWQDVKLKRQRCDQAPVVGGSWRDEKQQIAQRPMVRLLKTARSTTTGFRLVKRENSD